MAALIIQDLLANGTGDRKPMSVDAVKEELRTRTSKLTLRDTPVEEFASPDAVDTAGMKGDAPLYELRPSPNKGYGVFATQDIKVGTRLIAETPLVVVPPSEKDVLRIWKQFDKLTAEQLVKFNNLARADGTVDPRVRDVVHQRLASTQRYDGDDRGLTLAVDNEMKMRIIFNTNCVNMGSGGQWGVGLFELYSRINHSCLPNVHNSYNATIGKEVVHAVRAITKGEEIVTSYISNVRTKPQRTEQLAPYGFKCDCAACRGKSAAEHEIRRQRLFDLDQAFAMYDKGLSSLAKISGAPVPKNDGHALTWAEEMVALLKKEGLLGMDLAMAYRECSKYSLKIKQAKKALAFAQNEAEVDLYCLGPDVSHLESDQGDHGTAESWMKHIERINEAHEKAQKITEEARLQAKSEATKRAAYEEGKMAFEVAKKATKKAKRTIRNAAEKISVAPDEAELLITKLKHEEIAAMAQKLKDKTELMELKGIFQDQVKGLVGAGQVKKGELSSLG